MLSYRRTCCYATWFQKGFYSEWVGVKVVQKYKSTLSCSILLTEEVESTIIELLTLFIYMKLRIHIAWNILKYTRLVPDTRFF